ncbi:MAG: M4 family metallopeptidase, partial [Planctomycetota bacterium]
TDTSDLDGGKISMTPGLSAGDAAFLAADLFVSEYPNVQLENTVPQLMIYQLEVVGNSGSAALVWHTVIRSVSIYVVDEVVLVDAHTGEVALRYSQIKHAKDREIYDADSTAVIQGELARAEGDAPANQEDVDDCYDFLGDTYDFYELQHGRDSIDDDGITMIATVRFCPDPSDCPFANAVWAGFLTQMIYGEGWAVDDVVAHELTHGVTESESGLIYLNESGAINESFSDMWGEWVDLTNDPDDPEDRWLLGEDSPFGAFRDMADPTEFNHPDSKCSQWWYTGRGDNGGVHINSGVGNKLCYLLTDGDRFKGVEIVALNPDPVISISRVADLMYEAQTNLLTEASEYADLYVALTQAAVNLGWSDFEKFNLEVAAQVTELSGVCFDPANLPVFVDMMPPAPNPTQWDVEPQATGIQSIYMEAVGATDDSGVEYFFECLSDPSFSSNGWQDSSTYIINSPDLIRSGANDAYSFKVKARDKSDYQNETDYTPVKSVTLDVGSDTSSPAPDPARWALPPTLIRLEPSPTIRMSAQSAYDETGPAEYFFKCTAVDPSVVDMSIFDSGWQSSTTFTSRHASLIPGSTYTFVVIARDALGHETEPSVQVSVTLTNGGPTVLTVPEPYATIQDAIDAADTMLNSSPDALITVEVRPGTYSGNGNRDIDFKGLPITVRSVAPDDALTVAATIIDCGGVATGLAQDSHRAFEFKKGEGSDSMVAGFTITNGYISVDGAPGTFPGGSGANGAPSYGGGISCIGSSPTIQNCVIINCVAEGGWGGFG